MTFLDDPWAKFDRGTEHLQALDEILRVRLDEYGDTLKSEFNTKEESKPVGNTDPRPWRAFTLCVSELPVIGLEAGLLIGEILHHYRGALDHLAWILVKRGSVKRLSAHQQRHVAFPMETTRYRFKHPRFDKLPGVPKDQRAIIERYQPYRRSTKGRAIKYLRNLSDIDKHRVIVPAVIYPHDAKLNIKYRGGDLIMHEWRVKPGQELKQGTEILRIVLAVSAPEPEVNVKGTVKLTPSFKPAMARPAPEFTVLGVRYVLGKIKDVCSEILSQFEIRH